MTYRPCIVCGEPCEGSRCSEHQVRKHQTKTELGYDWRWFKLSRRARRMQDFCTDCGSTENLGCDHSPEAWARHEAGLPIRLQDVEVVCNDCNRRRGKARVWGKSNTPATRDDATCSGNTVHLRSDLAEMPRHSPDILATLSRESRNTPLTRGDGVDDVVSSPTGQGRSRSQGVR